MRIAFNAQLTREEITTLDKILHSAGFENRTDYVTALLQTTIHGSAVIPGKFPGETGTWISDICAIAKTRDATLDAILAAYDSIAFPVVAMRGGKTALELLRTEIEAIVLEQCGVLPAPEDLSICMNIYQNIRRPKLLQHRTRLLAEEFRQMHQREKNSANPEEN